MYQGFRPAADELLNPLFGNRQAIIDLHIPSVRRVARSVRVRAGGAALQEQLWYWGGRIALLTSSFPLAFYFNRNPQSFGKLIGTWVRFRNIFEISLHVVVAAVALNWFNYYGLLYWLVAYRYLDVGTAPRCYRRCTTRRRRWPRERGPRRSIGSSSRRSTFSRRSRSTISKVIYAAPPQRRAAGAHCRDVRGRCSSSRSTSAIAMTAGE